MKKIVVKTLAIAMVTSMILGSFTGCGNKSAKEDKANKKTVEKVDKAYTGEEKDAEESTNQKSDYKRKEPVAEETYPFELVPASEEIKNSRITDEIIQIGNVVLPDDFSLTVRDVLDRLSTDGKVSIQHSVDYVGGLHDTIKVYRKSTLSREDTGEELDRICELVVVSPSGEKVDTLDATVIGYVHPDNIHDLNFFYPGNICAGAYSWRYSNPVYMEEQTFYVPDIENYYRQRKQEYPDMDKAESQAFFEKIVGNADQALIKKVDLDENGDINIQIISKTTCEGYALPRGTSITGLRPWTDDYRLNCIDFTIDYDALFIQERSNGYE